MKVPQTIERNIYIEVEDSPEGQKILESFVFLLTALQANKAYLNGWIGPVPKTKKPK
jgi:hypothetical protein